MPKRWEYMALDCAEIEELNHYGADGWDLVGQLDVMVPDEDDTQHAQRMLVLKRELHDG